MNNKLYDYRLNTVYLIDAYNFHEMQYNVP